MGGESTGFDLAGEIWRLTRNMLKRKESEMDLQEAMGKIKQAKTLLSDANGIVNAAQAEMGKLRDENLRLAEARELQLPEGIEWPRFEDGELVKIGDEVEFEGEAAKVRDVAFNAEMFSLGVATATTSGRVYGAFGEPVKRPTPKVLGADGVPIEVGDTVYCDGDPEPLTVDSFDDPGCVYLTLDKNPNSMLYTVEPSRLSHERPDSWERLEQDAAKRVCEYAGAHKSIADADRYTCLECPYDEPGPHTDAGCHERMRLDLVRRAKALAKAGEVE